MLLPNKPAMISWIALFVVVALVLTAFVSFQEGVKFRRTQELAEEAKMQRLTEVVNKAIAASVADIKIQNNTIYRKAEREIIKEPVYSDCRLTPDGMQAVAEALRPRTDSNPNSKLP